MSLVSIFGRFYLNKNIGALMAEFLLPHEIIKMVRLSKRCNEVYSQDIIWWIHLYKSFPELRYPIFFLYFQSSGAIHGQKRGGRQTFKANKAYEGIREC